MSNTPLWFWVAFASIVLVMLAIDLGIFHKRNHAVKMREALIWTFIWIGLSLLFNVWVYFVEGKHAAILFLSGYLLEKSLSVDNLFVFLLIFGYFKIEQRFQHKILFWGIIGALVMRAVFIAAGITLINRFHWILYLFGVFLIYTAINLMWKKDEDIHPDSNPIVKFFYKWFQVTPKTDSGHFFIRENGLWLATPLFVVLIVVETTDVIFAMDSIPAVLALTRDPFIIYSSNVFAILGLRALYFALAGLMELFHHLHYGLAFILGFIGIKMLIADYINIPIGLALAVIIVALAVSIFASLLFPKEKA